MLSRTNSRTLATSETTLSVLEAVRDAEGVTLTSLAEELGLSKSTIHAHLATLRERGYVTKSGNQYDVGMKLLELGEYARRRRGLFDVARRTVNGLANRTNLEADFLVNERGRMILLYGEMGSTRDNNFPPGTHYYMHSTGTGKAILAELPDDEVKRVIDRWGLPAVTEQTITSEERLYQELETVRERGFGTNEEECMAGYRTIGAVVRDPIGEIVGGLGVGGAVFRVDEESLYGEVADELLEATDEFEESLRSAALP